MKDNLAKISGILRLVLVAVGLLFAVLFYADWVSVSEDNLLPEAGVSNFMKYNYVLLIGAAFLAVFFALYGFVLKFMHAPKKAMYSLIPILLLVAVVVIAYASASDAKIDIPSYEGTDNFDGSGTLKWTDTGLYATYIAMAGAVLAIVFAEVRSFFK